MNDEDCIVCVLSSEADGRIKVFYIALPFRGQALSRWLMSSEQGLRVTAVVTDSYGLSSSSGRKTSRDGEVIISAECFEPWEEHGETQILNIQHYLVTSMCAIDPSMNYQQRYIHWAKHKHAINCTLAMLAYCPFQKTHKLCIMLINSVWKVKRRALLLCSYAACEGQTIQKRGRRGMFDFANSVYPGRNMSFGSPLPEVHHYKQKEKQANT